MHCTSLTRAHLHAVLDEDAQEIQRLHSLSTRWLARSVLHSARALRTGQIMCRPYDIASEPRLYWQLMPELSFRLGERSFANHERQDSDVRALSDLKLKFYCLLAWQNLSPPTTVLTVQVRVFFGKARAGNPLDLALDRLLMPRGNDRQALCKVETGSVRQNGSEFPFPDSSGCAEIGHLKRSFQPIHQSARRPIADQFEPGEKVPTTP